MHQRCARDSDGSRGARQGREGGRAGTRVHASATNERTSERENERECVFLISGPGSGPRSARSQASRARPAVQALPPCGSADPRTVGLVNGRRQRRSGPMPDVLAARGNARAEVPAEREVDCKDCQPQRAIGHDRVMAHVVGRDVHGYPGVEAPGRRGDGDGRKGRPQWI